ncbi:MAG: acyl-CoA thioesterase [Rhodospirillales bacterium]|nr:acyl-CoA thioesterase [Rhodospirillales bacterium]MDE2318736.1 thioesterase family protein [Rhodospirillales bacterium]
MNLIFRLLTVILGAMWRPKLNMADVSELDFRVWPLDLDLNLHMTNSRYMALMDLGRTDLILRAGAWREMRRQKLGVVLGGAAMRFRRPLAPFARFTLVTRLLGWDERWMYVEQVFTGPQGVACSAAMRAAFVKAGQLVPPGPVLEAAVPGLVKLPAPAWAVNWAEVERAFAG